MLSPNTTLQNRYRIVRELGHGGMGTVYEAIDQRVNCVVALKETLATRGGEARKAFEHEAALLANLRHQALPKVMDYFSENDGDFLVMEFIPGYDLAELLDLRGGPFPQQQVLRWGHDLLRVLEYLHGQEPPILHRDIKPANLKLTKQGEIFLLDFGLAKGSLGQMPTIATNKSVRGYTPVYASVEQIMGHGTDARSDIYSLGATLFHLLSGFPPVDAPTRFHAVEDDQPDPLQSITSLNPQASANVADVIHQAIAISRKQRPISAAEMRKALRNAAEEDERYSAEEEYRRAEEIRRQREQAGVMLGTVAGSGMQEAKTRKQNVPATRDDETPRSQREKPEARPEIKSTVPGSTVRAPEPAQSSGPVLETLHTPPPERVSFGHLGSGANQTYQSQTVAPRSSKRAAIIGIAIVALVIVGVFKGWAVLHNFQQAAATKTEGQRNGLSATDSKRVADTAPEGMVYVSGGTFKMGRDVRDRGDEYERPAHSVTVKPFFIDTYEVTCEKYDKFVKATGHRAPPQWKSGTCQAGDERKPVTGVTWDDANDYSKWAGKRLPTEEEWEFAARGTDGRKYPWGNDWKPGFAHADTTFKGVADVGSYKGASSFGAFDMVGNAWEWTASSLTAYPGGKLPPQTGDDLKVIRGGSYESTKEIATTTYRTGWPARGAKTYAETGFRCVKDVTN